MLCFALLCFASVTKLLGFSHRVALRRPVPSGRLLRVRSKTLIVCGTALRAFGAILEAKGGPLERRRWDEMKTMVHEERLRRRPLACGRARWQPCLSRSFGLHAQVEDPELPEWLKEIPESRRIRTSNKVVFWSSPLRVCRSLTGGGVHGRQSVMIVRAFC